MITYWLSILFLNIMYLLISPLLLLPDAKLPEIISETFIDLKEQLSILNLYIPLDNFLIFISFVLTVEVFILTFKLIRVFILIIRG